MTVIVTVVEVPVHVTLLFVKVGVTVMVAVAGLLPVFTAVKVGMLLPDPLAARPMVVLLFAQLNTVPGTVPVKLMVCVGAPLHTVCAAGEADTVGVGFTVMVNEIDGPVHVVLDGPCDTEGVTVMVAVTGALPVLTAVKDGMFPVPLAPRPMLGLLFVQLNTVPGTGPLKFTGAVLEPLQTV